MTAEDRRDQIIDVAEKLFSRRGYEQTTLDDLAAEIGFTKPAIYYYFESKEAILFEIHDRIVRASLDGLKEIQASHDTAAEQLVAALEAHVDAVLGNADANRVFERDRHALSPDRARAIQQRDRQYERVLRTWHRQGIADGSLRPADSTVAVGAALGALNWAHRLPESRRKDRAAMARELVAAAVDGLLDAQRS